jgi:hypothetical protein
MDQGHCQTRNCPHTIQYRSKSKVCIPPSVSVDEEDLFTKTFTWGIKEHLLPVLKKRYLDFKCNSHFWSLLNGLKENPKLCRVRHLDTKTKKGMKQAWYNPLIVGEFDNHYKKSKSY